MPTRQKHHLPLVQQRRRGRRPLLRRKPSPTPPSAPSTAHPATPRQASKGDVLTVEFTVIGLPCLGLNGGPAFKHSEAFSFQVATDDPSRNRSLLERHRRQRRPGKPVRLVQGQVGTVLADHARRADESDSPIPTAPPPSARSMR